MVPYILNALILTTASYLLMYWNVIRKPFVNGPVDNSPDLSDTTLFPVASWRAAIWGAISILIAMTVYYPFARVAERQRLLHRTIKHGLRRNHFA